MVISALSLYASTVPKNIVRFRGGRLGNAATRAQIEDIAKELQARGYTISGGGGMFPEEYLMPIGGGRRGGS